MDSSLMLPQTLYLSQPRITKDIALTGQVADRWRINASGATTVSAKAAADNNYGTKALIGGAKWM